MNIFFIGYMGSGKSTIGQKFSELLKYEYVDLDTYIQDREGLLIPEIFKTKGEIYFRKAENKYLKEVLHLEKTILSLGGGTPCYGNNMELITTSPKSKSVYLKSSIPNLVVRLYNERASRPLIAHLNDKDELTEFIGKHLFERSQYYSQSDITISTDNKSINDILEELVTKLF